jgi:hypothetical protein
MRGEPRKVMFDYRVPRPRAKRRLPVLPIIAVALPVVVPASIWTAARIAQRVLGLTVLHPSDVPFAAPLAFCLEPLPLIVVTIFYIWTCVHATLRMWNGSDEAIFRGDPSPHYARFLLCASIAGWIAFVVLCVPIWEEISP